MNANAASPATPPLATSTLNDLLRWINEGDRYLAKRVHEPKGREGSTRNITQAETALADKLETIKSRDRWLDTLEKKFLIEYGNKNISSEQWNRLKEKFQESEKGVREERKKRNRVRRGKRHSDFTVETCDVCRWCHPWDRHR